MRCCVRWPGVVCLSALAATAIGVAACSQGMGRTTASPRVIADGEPVPKGGGIYKVGEPYQIDGQWFVPREEAAYDRSGIASYYAEDFHGRRTSNGEVFDMWALTAAHPTLPLPSYAYVTNLDNGRTLLVRVNDRGPYAEPGDRRVTSRRSLPRFRDPGHRARSSPLRRPGAPVGG